MYNNNRDPAPGQIHFHILTLFPDFFDAFLETSIIGKAYKQQAFGVTVKDIRDHAINKNGQVDDLPFGGGAGMVLRPEPIFDTFSALEWSKKENKKVLYFSPKGRKIDHNYIISLTKLENIALLCGHYEGIDQRVIDTFVDEEVSIGDFVVTGGELPAMLLMDGVIRQLEGVIKASSLEEESFTHNLLEYNHYTRPREYKNLKVPEVLFSGNHKKIDEHRLAESIKETLIKRPDLIENNMYENTIQDMIQKIKEELSK